MQPAYLQAIEKLPRQKLMELPSPLEDWGNLVVGDAQIMGKRDDIGPLAFGGNKLRKLEFEIPAALRANARVLVTTGGVQSNHARLTAAVAARLNLECHLILNGPRPDDLLANLLVDELCGAKLHFVSTGSIETVEGVANKLMRNLKAEGRLPFWIPLGGANGRGTIAYVAAFEEFAVQAEKEGVHGGTITVAAGTGSTAAGLALGNYFRGSKYKIRVISVSRSTKELRKDMYQCINEALKEITVDCSNADHVDFEIDSNYIGEGYTKPTKAAVRAVRHLASHLGVLSDLSYTGKAAAAFLDSIADQPLGSAHVFWHTGGAPEIFSRNSEVFKL